MNNKNTMENKQLKINKSLKFSVSGLRSQKRGFTILEVMVASTIFILVVVSGITVLLNVTHNLRITGEIRQSMDSLGFAMEDISRNVRLGTAFDCNLSNKTLTDTTLETNSTCAISLDAQGHGTGLQRSSLLAFEGYQGNPTISADQIVYKIELGRLSKSTDGGSNYVFITPANVTIDSVRSGFSVRYADDTNHLVPLVTIRLYGTVTYQTTVVPFNIQTSVTSRNR